MAAYLIALQMRKPLREPERTQLDEPGCDVSDIYSLLSTFRLNSSGALGMIILLRNKSIYSKISQL